MQREQKKYQLLCKAADDANIILNQNDGRFTSIELTSLSDVPDSENDMPEKIKVQTKNLDGLMDNPRKQDGERLRDIRKFLSNKVFILTPCKNIKNDEYYGQQVHVYDADKFEILKNNNNFAPVPILTPETVNNADDKESFEELLKNSKTLGSFSNPWPTKDFTPYAIIWKDKTGLYVYTDINKSANRGGISFSVNSLKSFYKSINWLDNRFVVDGYVVFIDKDSLVGSKSRENDLSYNTDETEIGNEKSMEVEKDEININGDKVMDDQRDEIFENFKNCVINKYGLTYDNKDLVNFHNSLKTNILTILAGISGTGKSKIATAYADSLGIKKDKDKGNDEQFNMVSVRPFWQDDSDLLGFVDTISNTYHPGDSSVVDTLISAYKNRDKMYIIVFDEMNLARVEHYFSQFLSVLEKDPMDRKLQLYNKKLQARLYNGDQYPAELLIPENVRFVGTMNIDESTFQMSDKVLDRANVITLKSVKFVNRLNNRNEYGNDNHFDEIGYKTYEASVRKDYSFSKKQLQFFDQLNSCINKQLPTVGIGWRTLNSIEKFVGDIDNHHYDSFNTDDAFDYQVAQRILPKIRGTKLMLNILLDPDSDDSIYKILDNYRYISDFSFTRELLDKKNREIEVIGFAN